MDEDLDGLSREQLRVEVTRLRAGIRAHRDSTGHDLCWHHPALWSLLPEPVAPEVAVPAWPQFMRGCVRYRESLDEQLPAAPRTTGEASSPGERGAALRAESPMQDLKTLSDKQEIVEVITDLFVATDRRGWAAVLECFAPQVTFDVSSLGGPPAALVPAPEIVAAWEKGLAPLAAVHHQAGNFRVWPRGDDADASCYGIASHYRPTPSGRNTRVFVGSYDFGLRREGGRWRITRFRFDAKYVDGNLELEK